MTSSGLEIDIAAAQWLGAGAGSADWA